VGAALGYTDASQLDERKRMGPSHRRDPGPAPGMGGPTIGNQARLRRKSAGDGEASGTAKPQQKSPVKTQTLTYDEVAKLVAANNASSQSDALLIALIYKESNFDSSAKAKGSTATGLMQMTKTAVKELQRVYPGEFSKVDLTDPAENIRAGSKYLALMIERAKGVVATGLDKYGTGPGYSKSILAAETELKAKPADPMEVLRRLVHP
jgi:hypothetical protein